MASEGPLSPNTSSNDSSTGSDTWSSPSNIYTEDDTFATSLGSLTYWLKSGGYGFDIPTDATIDGIVVRIKKDSNAVDGNDPPYDGGVRIVKAGTIAGDDKAAGGYWPYSGPTGDANSAYTTYGGSSDLWGETWSPSDINDSGFGAAISAGWETPDATNAKVDHFDITVYYTEDDPPPEGGDGTITGVSSMTGVSSITL